MHSTADPEKPFQVHAGGRSRMWIERIARVNHGADFLALVGCGQGGEHKAGASRRVGAADFGVAPAREPASHGIDLGDAAGSDVGYRPDFQTGGWGYAGQLGRS